ncbi:MAG: glycosyltransferase [Betaproteobacteria bacterium]|nr:glycosyltransferase [Betaproteobacteria bacterium]
MLSVIIPVLNEAAGIRASLLALQPLRAQGHEIILADGGSSDGTLDLGGDLVDALVEGPRGRATQMNAGAAIARGEVLLFLHADTALPANAAIMIAEGLASAGKSWGRFDVNISGASPWFPIIAFMINCRSRLTGIATGDQAIFVYREIFRKCNGFAAIPLMEDIDLCARLKRISRPLCLRARVTTSGRRWEKHGVWRTIVLMGCLRLRYFLGASPEILAQNYYRNEGK